MALRWNCLRLSHHPTAILLLYYYMVYVLVLYNWYWALIYNFGVVLPLSAVKLWPFMIARRQLRKFCQAQARFYAAE